MAAEAGKAVDPVSQVCMKKTASSIIWEFAILFLLLPVLLCTSCSGSGQAPRRVLVVGFDGEPRSQERNALLEYGCRRLEAELGLAAELSVPYATEDPLARAFDDHPPPEVILSCRELPGETVGSSPGEGPAPCLVCIDHPGDPLPAGRADATCIRYRVEEGAYICGFLAGLLTVSGEHPLLNRLPVVAFIGIADDPRTSRYQAGYVSGVKASCPQAQILSYLVDDSGDGERARAQLLEAARKGADVVFCTPGDFNAEVVREAEALDLLLILVGGDRNGESPSRVLTSLILRDDNALFRAVHLVLRGELGPGLQEWGLREGIWSLAPFHGHDVHIRRETKQALAAQSEKVPDMRFSP